jgi:hypothetical protein
MPEILTDEYLNFHHAQPVADCVPDARIEPLINASKFWFSASGKKRCAELSFAIGDDSP